MNEYREWDATGQNGINLGSNWEEQDNSEFKANSGKRKLERYKMGTGREWDTAKREGKQIEQWDQSGRESKRGAAAAVSDAVGRAVRLDVKNAVTDTGRRRMTVDALLRLADRQ